MRSRHKKVRGKDLGDHRAGDRERWDARAGMSPRALQPGVSHRGQHDVAMPSDKRATLEMIEPEFVFEFFVLLLDRPSMMCQSDERSYRGRRRQRDEVRLDAWRRTEVPFEQQPDFGRHAMGSPVVGRSDPQRSEVRGPWAIRA